MIISYDRVRHLIKDADILLFKGGKFPSIGWWIAKYSQSPYSHVGLAYWKNDRLYCLEFREFKGARQYPLSQYVSEYPGRIDVFRSCERIEVPVLVNNQDTPIYCSYEIYNFTQVTAKKIIKHALELIEKNENYGYHLIWRMAKGHIPFLRLFDSVKYDDENGTLYVCSTLVTKTYRKYFVDPVDFLSDEYTTPGNIARSVMFRRLFTIE